MATLHRKDSLLVQMPMPMPMPMPVCLAQEEKYQVPHLQDMCISI
jgi:hypothetical protein